jgi:hypothetical protein
MKRILVFASAAIVLFAAVTLISKPSVKGNDGDRQGGDREDERNLEVQIGLSISPVKLNLKDKDPDLVGLGSYIVNAQAGCSDCHTCPSYKPGHNPFRPPFGVSGDGQFNDVGYLAGGVDFGPPPSTVTSHNITPDPSMGKPDGLTLRQFYVVMRTGHDPVRNDNLAVMPWPYFRYMTDRDLDAIYAFLSAIPSATPPATHCRLF